MDIFSKMTSLCLIAVFLENTIFTYSYGTSTMFTAARTKRQIVPFSLCIMYICVTSSIMVYFADKYLLSKFDSELYTPFVYVLIIAIIYISTLLLLWKFTYKLFKYIKKFVHLSAFNCAVLSSLFINKAHCDSLIEYISFAIGTGIAFFFATLMLSVVYNKLNSDKVADSFRGFPAMLIYVGIISMAFFALSNY